MARFTSGRILLLGTLQFLFASHPAMAQQQAEWTWKDHFGHVRKSEDLHRILAQHETWLTSNGSRGKQADLSGADLTGANLRSAFLTKVQLESSILGEADLTSSNLEGVNFRNASLVWTQLYHAKLSSADLTNTNLSSANLAYADLTDAQLSGADFSRVDRKSTRLNSSHLVISYAVFCLKKK